MSHLVESMAYVGQTPWHGLGNQLSHHRPLDEWLVEAGLNWRIEDTPVRFLVGETPYLGQVKEYPDSKVLYRSDTLAPLSVVGNRYKVVQPREILEFYRDLTDKSGFEMETAGVLKGGRKIWALARTGQSGVLAGKDVTNAYVLLATACDGTLATTAQFTRIRVVCNNTLSVAVNDSTGAVKVPHRSVFDPDSVKRQLGISVSAWDEYMYRLKHLSDRRVTPAEVEAYLKKVFLDPKAVSRMAAPSVKPQTRAMATVVSLFQGQGVELH